MRSSKWLVFIRSRLAGFDRSLTTSITGWRATLETINVMTLDEDKKLRFI